MDTFLLETVVVGAGPTAVLPLGRPMSGRTGNRNLILTATYTPFVCNICRGHAVDT